MGKRIKISADAETLDKPSPVGVPRRTKIALVAVVLTIGLALAFQFRKKDVKTGSNTAAAPSAAESSAANPSLAANVQPAVPQANSLTGNNASPLDVAAAPANVASAETAAPQLAASTSASVGSAPPEPLPNEDHTAAGTGGPKSAGSAVPALPNSFATANQSNPTDASDFHSEHSAPATSATHKIVDGDSLPRLAEQYLGSASRADEIFACNRDVLSDPELLPIGVRLRIPSGPPHALTASAEPATASGSLPPGSSATATATATATAASAPPASAASASQPPLASTAKAPLLDIAPAELSPLPPLGDQSHPPGRIYIVQPGDTLAGIAQKFYADGSRTDAILQANREQIRSEQDLRPGLLLEVP